MRQPFTLLIIAIWVLYAGVVTGQEESAVDERVVSLQATIKLNVARYDALQNKLNNVAAILPKTVTEATRILAELDKTNSALNVTSAEIALTRSENLSTAIDVELFELRKMNLAVLRKLEQAQITWYETVQQALIERQLYWEDVQLKKKKQAFTKELNDWKLRLNYQREQALKKVTSTSASDEDSSIQPDLTLLQAEEKVQWLGVQVMLLEAKQERRDFQQQVKDAKTNVSALLSINKKMQALKASLHLKHEQVKAKLLLIQQYKDVLIQRQAQLTGSEKGKHDNEVLLTLERDYSEAVNELEGVSLSLDSLQGSLTKGRSGLLTRQVMPSLYPFDKLSWGELLESMAYLPSLSIALLNEQWHKMTSNFSKANSWRLTLLLITELLFLVACYFLWGFLRQTLQQKNNESTTFVARMLHFSADSLARNILSVSVFAVIGTLSIIWAVLGTTLWTVAGIAVVILVFRFMITVARMVFLENLEDIEGRDVKLFRLMRFAFSLAGLLTVGMVLVHQLVLPVDVVAIFDRLYMVILLLVSYPPLRYFDVVSQLLLPEEKKSDYLQKSLRLLLFLVPLTIFTNAIIGLLGFVNLAWAIGKAAAQVILILSLWLAVTSVLADTMTIVSNWCIKKLANGWLWTQAVLEPLHRLLLIVIAVVFVGLILAGFDVNLEAEALEKLNQFLYYPFVNFGAINVSLVSVILLGVVVAFVSWSIKWSREFSYRWLFQKVRDSSVRDSLALFTQYGIVIIGFFLILSVLGIDLTTLTVLAAAFSVGIAFGVRDIVNNVLSGILLLIERPVRKGDWISVMEHEGEVTEIGLRAITLLDSKNKEVIVPNTETMTKTFINWTRRDSIVREWFHLRVAFQEDPGWVCDLVAETVSEITGVLNEPSVHVLIREVGEMALLLEVRYYVDMRHVDSRAELKSLAINTVWETLKMSGVSVPYPQHNIHLHRG